MSKGVDVTGFDHTRVYVSDMERSRDFYERVLGMEFVSENPKQDSPGIRDILGYEGAAVHLVFGRIGGHLVELIHTIGADLPQPPDSHVGGSGFTLTVADIDAAREFCMAEGVEVLTDILVVKGTKIFFIREPDGAKIELIQYADGHHAVRPHVVQP